jgi:diguanylate cyclase (GGDEF)-like protein
MTMLDDLKSTLIGVDAAPGGEIEAIAVAAAAAADRDPHVGELVIVARTANGGHRAVGGGNVGPLRAAISVAVAAGNTRLWEGATDGDTVERSVRSLPEVVRTAAEASGVHIAHVGCVQDDSIAAVAVWFEIDGNVADPAERRHTMQLLDVAAEHQREFLEARAAAVTAETSSSHDDSDGTTGRSFDADDPHLDATTGLATRAEFEQAMAHYESDEATLVVVDLDGFSRIGEQYGEQMTDSVLRVVADRLVGACRGTDLIARIGIDTFAVLFSEASRAVGLRVAKRLLDEISLPLDIGGGPEKVTATVALAHQFGLVDMEELFESADDAIASGKRAGTGRLVVAS